jgi:hypothetical protein
MLKNQLRTLKPSTSFLILEAVDKGNHFAVFSHGVNQPIDLGNLAFRVLKRSFQSVP